MAVEEAIARNLRGVELARQIHHLNGHQALLRFVFFHPAWFFMILTIGLVGLVSVLKYAVFLGLLGLLMETVLLGKYFASTRRIDAYPGIVAWLGIQLRRHVMGRGRNVGRLSRPA